MIDLDACRQVVIDQQDIDTMSIGIEPSELLRDLLGGYLDIALVRGRSAMALYDPVAAAALLCPDRFSMVTADLEVELLDADTRGRTVVTSCPGGQGNVEIVECLDVPAIRNLLFSTLESRA